VESLGGGRGALVPGKIVTPCAGWTPGVPAWGSFKGEVFCKSLIIYRFSLASPAVSSPQSLMPPSA
jgi:hypothetical protein